MPAALLFAAMLLQGNMAPTFSEGPETPAAIPAQTAPAPARVAPNKVVSTVTVTAAPVRVGFVDPVKCQTVEVTGTRFGTKRCLTASQWAQQARDAKDLYNAWSAGGAITSTH